LLTFVVTNTRNRKYMLHVME